ncbi:hypothetical protein V6N12_029360 [Hibiscus sabdariffa]|uniref:Uncharacterized protein n=1 Tax=Hibiscus sabdariffa TaxID=183260 RepID=A0ABR2CVW5_9ROSI
MIVASPAVVVVACTRHRRDSGRPFDEPRLPTTSSFPSFPRSRLGFDHPRPRMSQIETRLVWLEGRFTLVQTCRRLDSEDHHAVEGGFLFWMYFVRILVDNDDMRMVVNGSLEVSGACCNGD